MSWSLCSMEKTMLTTIIMKVNKNGMRAIFPLHEIFIATGQKRHKCDILIGDVAVILMVTAALACSGTPCHVVATFRG